MLAHNIFALIDNNKIQNTIICDHYHIADGIAKSVYSPTAFAVEITQIPTAIGHSYIDGNFKDEEGNIITPLPTTEDEVRSLKSENELLQSALTEMTTYAASQDERINLQEQTLLELTTTIAGGNA